MAETLLNVAARAIAEHAAWTARNQARKALQKWKRDAGYERGEEIKEGDWEAEDWAEIKAMESAASTAQRKLETARAATRRAIAKAADTQGRQHG